MKKNVNTGQKIVSNKKKKEIKDFVKTFYSKYGKAMSKLANE